MTPAPVGRPLSQATSSRYVFCAPAEQSGGRARRRRERADERREARALGRLGAGQRRDRAGRSLVEPEDGEVAVVRRLEGEPRKEGDAEARCDHPSRRDVVARAVRDARSEPRREAEGHELGLASSAAADEGLVGQLGDADFFSARERMGRRDDDEHLVRPHGNASEVMFTVLVAAVLERQGDVDVAAPDELDGGGRVFEDDLERECRLVAAQTSHRGRDDRRRRAGERREADGRWAAARGSCYLVGCRGGRREQRIGATREGAARGGQRDSVAAADEQLHAELGFEATDVMRDRRLRVAERTPSSTQRPFAGHRAKDDDPAKVVQREAAQGNTFRGSNMLLWHGRH